jgi:hypothetical protein
VHSLSGVAKRLLSTPKPPRPLSSLLTITGYASLFVFVPIHFLTHRVNPTTTTAPVFSVGPSELDYEFVKVGLHTWPWRSWILYTGLVSLVALHAAQGASTIWNSWLHSYVGRKRRSGGNKFIVMGGIIASVLSGLYILSREPLMTFPSVAARFQAALAQSWVYRL